MSQLTLVLCMTLGDGGLHVGFAQAEQANPDSVKYLIEARNRAEKRLRALEQELLGLQTKSPDLETGKIGIKVLEERLGAIEAKISALKLRQTELAANLEAFEQAIRDKRPREELLARIYADKDHQAVLGSKTEDALLAKKLALELLLQDYGASHFKVLSLKKEIEVISEFLRDTQNVPGKDGSSDPILAYRRALKTDLDMVKVQAAALQKLLEAEYKEAHQQSWKEKVSELQKNIGLQRALHDTIVRQLDALLLRRDR